MEQVNERSKIFAHKLWHNLSLYPVNLVLLLFFSLLLLLLLRTAWISMHKKQCCSRTDTSDNFVSGPVFCSFSMSRVAIYCAMVSRLLLSFSLRIFLPIHFAVIFPHILFSSSTSLRQFTINLITMMTVLSAFIAVIVPIFSIFSQ